VANYKYPKLQNSQVTKFPIYKILKHKFPIYKIPKQKIPKQKIPKAQNS
jgi:hypothetical protein